MRVLYFTRDYTPHDHRFLTALAGSGHEIYSLRLERGSVQREDRALPPEITQVTWRGGKKPARWLDGAALLADLKRVLREVRPEVVHAGSVQTAAFLTALAGFRPLVTMSWGSDLLKDADRNAWWRWATRFTLKRTTALVGDCLAVQNKAAALGFPPERARLFPWGVDLAHFRPGLDGGLRERLGWQDAFVLLSNRAWEPLYGVDVVVRAFIQAARELPNLRLMLLGSGSQAAHLRQMLMDGGVLERVHFGGQVSQDRLAGYYRAADLYISASHSDGSSVSLMEALASGCAVLVSDIPGNREWIEAGRAGWLFPDGDSDALAAGIRQAVTTDLGTMRGQARALAEDRADWSKNFQVLLQAYDLAVRWNSARVSA